MKFLSFPTPRGTFSHRNRFFCGTRTSSSIQPVSSTRPVRPRNCVLMLLGNLFVCWSDKSSRGRKAAEGRKKVYQEIFLIIINFPRREPKRCQKEWRTKERKRRDCPGFDVIKSKMWTIMTLIMSHRGDGKFSHFSAVSEIIDHLEKRFVWVIRVREPPPTNHQKSHYEEIFTEIYDEMFPLNFLLRNFFFNGPAADNGWILFMDSDTIWRKESSFFKK